MNKIALTISLVMIILLSCKKKEEPVVTNDPPVFFFQGKINGSATAIYSGTNDYFMYSDHGVDVNNVKEFRGELKTRSCSECTNSLKLIIKDYRLLDLTPTIIDSSIRSRFYNYCTPAGTPNSYNVNFIPQFFGGSPQSYNWTFHDGNSNATNPLKIYSQPGEYNVCLNINSTSSCSSSLCNTIKIGQTGNGVEVGFSHSAPIGNALSFTAQPALGFPPYSYSWNFGDSFSSNVANPTHTFSTNGVYLVTLTVTDSKNNSAQFQMNVGTSSPGTCMAKFNYVKSAISNSINLANIILEWTDQNGNTYSSNSNLQPSTSGFEIKTVNEYLNNENHQKTKKISAKFNCILYNGSSSILIEDAEIIFAVAY